jgi:predicted phage tail protein
MTTKPIISGAGSGKAGGSGGGLSEQADTLKSTSYAQVLDLICEGEIGGLVNGLQSIYLDDTPIQNPDGSNNFTGVNYATVNGTQTQSTIAGFDQSRAEFTGPGEAKVSNVNSSSPPVTISNSNVSSVVVTVEMPGLTFLDDTGNLGGTEVNYAIDVNTNSGGWVEKVNDTVSGKSSSAYQRQYRISLPTGTSWQVRLRRITPDATSAAKLNNKTFFKNYTEIIDAKLRYPNSALVALKIDASQFRAIPKRGYDVKLLKIKFPSNATARADGSLAYSGTWNGTFQIGWCACPAWAYYDLVTTDRYGLGNYVDPSQVDKWSLYTISKYCNELISDGFGGTEPRFTCNVWINTRQEAYKVLNDFTSIFRGMAYWGTGAVTAVQDAPKDPVFLFSNSNVVSGQFSYQGSSAKGRHTVALVQWNDPDDQYRQKIEYVEDTVGIARYGIIETQIVAFGCTSRGQAHRLGRWLLYSERYETEVVAFKTGGEGAMCRPGDVIKVADQFRAGQRLGGRISSATSTTVTVDSLVTVPGGALTLYVVGADGTVQTRSVSGTSGNVITVSSPFDTVPQAQLGWVLSSASVSAQTFRVLTVNESDNGEHEVTALTYEPSKYDFIENNLTLVTRTITSLSPTPSTVASITFSEVLYFYQNDVRSKLSVYWAAATGAVRYRIEWRFNGGNWTYDETSSTDYEILDTIPAKYEVRIYSIGVFGTQSQTYATANFTTSGKSAPPSDVTGFTANIDPQVGISLVWNNVTDIDLAQYEIRQGASWAAGTPVTRIRANTYTLGAISGTAQTFWIKAIDTSGIYSLNAASYTSTFSAPGTTTMSAQVIDNNVLLKWTAVTATLAIDYYEIRRGASWAAGTVVGRVANATFTTLFETAAGTYAYWIAAYDIGGNVGTATSVSAVMSQPPDYQLLLNVPSTFSGTKSSAVVNDGVLYLGVDTTTTYQAHFTGNAWTSPQDQITAGYPYWIEPTANASSYEEVIDYGSSIPAAKVSIVPTVATGFGTPTVAYTISVSNTSATGPWTNYAGVTEVYATTFRWIKVRIDVTGAGGDDIVQVSSLVTKLDVKQKDDYGSIACNSADVGGTTVTFNKPFNAITSITLTPAGTTARYCIYDFAGGANPTSFKALLYDNSGTRLSGTVSWTARGY